MHNLKERVEVQELYSVKDCLANPHKLYIFGDNLIGVGKGGQAVIRDCPNTFGVPTKRLPTNDENAFFSDLGTEMDELEYCLNALYRYYLTGVFYKTISTHSNLPILVFPSGGLGTGLSQMPTKSPNLYKAMNEFIYDYFGVKYE